MSGYPMIDALNATHPLTPREKVPSMPTVDLTDDMLFEVSPGEVVTWAEIKRRTALASGSGDHAELARLAEAATPGPWLYRDMTPNTYGPAFVDSAEVQSLAICGEAVGLSETHGFCLQVDSEVRMANAAFIAAANPATVLALLAEIAALWTAVEIRDGHINRLIDRATEAERKLAEAVGLNDRAAELMRQCTDPERFEGASTLNVYANMRAWLSDLSKEAERG